MKFRPCIDIHNGKVKQIVGGSLKDAGNQATENFVSQQDGAFYASLYKENGLKGGHIILLNHADSEYFEATRQQAFLALGAYPKGLQLGGGVNPQNGDRCPAHPARFSEFLIGKFTSSSRDDETRW